MLMLLDNAKITARITDLDNRRSELTTRESKQLQQFTKTLEECQEVLSREYYHKRGTLAPVPYNGYERYHASAPRGTIRPLQR